jgi:hypothetical protein
MHANIFYLLMYVKRRIHMHDATTTCMNRLGGTYRDSGDLSLPTYFYYIYKVTLFESLDGRLYPPNTRRVVPTWFWIIPPGLMSVGTNNEICVSCTGRQLSSLNLKRIWNHYHTDNWGIFLPKILYSFLVPILYLF